MDLAVNLSVVEGGTGIILGGSPPAVSRKAWLVGLVALGIVVCAGAGLLPILEASLVGAMALVVFGVLTPVEARNAVELNVVLVIAASFGLGAAVESSGLAARLAGGLLGAFGAWGSTGIVLGVVLATLILTELITNNAAAALVFPIAVATAERAALDVRTVAIVVAITASASFLTPIGYQTNTMVYGLGGYRFGDYARLGFPLTVVVVAALVMLA